MALDSLRPNTTSTRDLTLHWSWIHFSAEHKRRTNSFKPLLLYFRRVTVMSLNCSRQLFYNWNLRWWSADSFAIMHLRRSGAAVLPRWVRYKIQTGIRPCFSSTRMFARRSQRTCCNPAHTKKNWIKALGLKLFKLSRESVHAVCLLDFYKLASTQLLIYNSLLNPSPV